MISTSCPTSFRSLKLGLPTHLPPTNRPPTHCPTDQRPIDPIIIVKRLGDRKMFILQNTHTAKKIITVNYLLYLMNDICLHNSERLHKKRWATTSCKHKYKYKNMLCKKTYTHNKNEKAREIMFCECNED